MKSETIMTVGELFDWEERSGINRQWSGDREVHDVGALSDLLHCYGISLDDMDALVVCSWDDDDGAPHLPDESMHIGKL